MPTHLPPFAPDFGLDPQGRVLLEATPVQRIGLVLAMVSAVFVPMWIRFGRFAVVGGGGWLMLMMMMASVVVFLVYGAITVLALMRVSKVRPGVPGRKTSLFLLSAVALALFVPGSYEDFGDTGDSSPSVLQTWLGVSSEVTMVVFAALSGLFVLATGATLVTAIIELGEVDKVKRQRMDALNAALTQNQAGSRHGLRGPQR